MLKNRLVALARRVLGPAFRAYAVRGPVEFGERVHIGPGSRVESFHGLTVGDDVYIGKYSSVVVDGRIGNDVLIANNVGLVGRHDHDHTAIGIGIRRAPWIGDDDYSGPGLEAPLVIEDDVWIGFGAVVLSGTTVGRGAIVAAGAVVIDDVAPYDIVAGNPARPVARRFDDASVRDHERALYGATMLGSLKVFDVGAAHAMAGVEDG